MTFEYTPFFVLFFRYTVIYISLIVNATQWHTSNNSTSYDIDCSF